MNKTQILPLILVIIDFVTGMVYCCNGDYRRFVYWFAAAILTITVTF